MSDEKTSAPTRMGRAVLHCTEGVVSAHATFGPHDIIALVEAGGQDELSDLVARQIQGISEITDTMTCIVLDRQ